MKCKRYLLLALLILLSTSVFGKPLYVVATTSDLANLTKQIGKDAVQVYALTNGVQDVHHVDPRPSMVFKLSKADLLVRVGMDLDMWINSLIDTSKNRKIFNGAAGHLDASKNIKKRQIPTGRIDPGMGDIHIYGNPHYWLDPLNGDVIARQITDKLSELMPDKKEYFEKNYDTFHVKLMASMARWNTQMNELKGKSILTYHASWVYFANRFNLNVVGTLEPQPGIEPSVRHLATIQNQLKSGKIALVMMEPYLNVALAQKAVRGSNVPVKVVPASVGGSPGATDYIALFDTIVSKVSAK